MVSFGSRSKNNFGMHFAVKFWFGSLSLLIFGFGAKFFPFVTALD